ncbi:MAG: DNA polymerase III subunit delta [Candidatus Latescibacterota bacterium]
MAKMLAKYKKLFDSIRKGDIQSLYYLYGPEEYLKKEFISDIIRTVLPGKNRAFNLDILHGDEFDRTAFDDRLSSFPLFTDRRMVILKRFEVLSTANKDVVLAKIQKIPDSIVFIAESGEDIPSTARSKTMKQLADRQGISFEFRHLDEAETMARVEGRFKKEGLTIEREALELLVDSVGTGLSDLINEVEKIVLHAGDDKLIKQDNIKDVIGRYRTENLFEILGYLSGGDNASIAIRKINRLIDGGEEPVFILAMLLKRAIQLLQVKLLLDESGPRARGSQALAGKLRRSAFHVDQLIRQSDKFEQGDLEILLDNLRWADFTLKTSTIDPKHLFEEALLASSLRKKLAPRANLIYIF